MFSSHVVLMLRCAAATGASTVVWVAPPRPRAGDAARAARCWSVVAARSSSLGLECRRRAGRQRPQRHAAATAIAPPSPRTPSSRTSCPALSAFRNHALPLHATAAAATLRGVSLYPGPRLPILSLSLPLASPNLGHNLKTCRKLRHQCVKLADRNGIPREDLGSRGRSGWNLCLFRSLYLHPFYC